MSACLIRSSWRHSNRRITQSLDGVRQPFRSPFAVAVIFAAYKKAKQGKPEKRIDVPQLDAGQCSCLWVAWYCCGISPLYWFGTGLCRLRLGQRAVHGDRLRCFVCDSSLWSDSACEVAYFRNISRVSTSSYARGVAGNADDGIGHHAASSERRAAPAVRDAPSMR